MKPTLIAAACLALAPAASLAAACDDLRAGVIPALTPFEEIGRKMTSADLKKDEFETTAAFEARVAAAEANLLSQMSEVAFAWNIAGGILTYNADAGAMTVSGNLLTCSGAHGLTERTRAVRHTPKGRGAVCIDWTISRSDGPPTEYEDEFGLPHPAPSTIIRSQTVFAGLGDGTIDPVTGRPRKGNPPPAFTLALAPDAARSLKENARFILVVRPKSPFFWQATRVFPATAGSAYALVLDTDFLVADVSCAGLADAKTGKVYGVLAPG